MAAALQRLFILLGNINTGGNRIRKADLRDALAKAGWLRVATVRASGNVLFDGVITESEKYAAEIVDLLDRQFGITTFAIVTTRTGLLSAIAENPFVEDGAENFVHVHFLECQPDAEAFALLARDHIGRGPERLAPGTGALHIDLVVGVGNSRLTGPFIARRLGCRDTARSIRSLSRIAQAMA